MENRTYVTSEVGFDALFEAMLVRASEDMQSDNAKVADDAKVGLAEWLEVMRATGSGDALDIDRVF